MNTNRSRLESTKQNKTFLRLGLLLSVPFVLVVLVLAFFTVVEIDQKVTLVLWTIGLGFFSVFVFLKTSGDVSLNRTLTLIASYLVFAYPFKAILSQSELGDLQRRDFYISGELFTKSLLPAVAYTSGAVISLMLVYFLVRRLDMSRFERSFAPRMGRLFLFIGISLLVKFVAQHILIWGVPNQPPRNVVPLVTGAVVMYCKLGIFHLVALAITLMFIYKTKMSDKVVLGSLIAGYLLLDFSVGSKYSLVYVVVAMVFSIALLKNEINLGQARVVMVLVACLAIISLYPVIHNYRFARKSNPRLDQFSLIQKAIRLTTERSDTNIMVDSVLQVAKRINGFQNHAAAVNFSATLRPGWKELLSSAEASQSYTQAVTGIDHESNTFGITHCGMMTMMFRGNWLQVFVSGILLNLALTGLVVFSSYLITRVKANWYAAGLSNGLFLVFAQFTGGNLGFSAKQYVTILFTIYMCNYFFVKKKIVVKRPIQMVNGIPGVSTPDTHQSRGN
ncbi:MAG: hypothetical protein R3C03_18320 [Pirellulaceae bacterium]